MPAAMTPMGGAEVVLKTAGEALMTAALRVNRAMPSAGKVWASVRNAPRR